MTTTNARAAALLLGALGLACGGDGAGDSTTAPSSSTASAPLNVVASTKIRVTLGADGRLVYYSDAKGDIVPDFSHAGYGGGGVRLPNVPIVITLTPVAGDDRANIQAALDAAGRLPADANGFRGAVLLKAGRYEVADSLLINRSGVVLRGEGQGADGTLIVATGAGTRNLIRVQGAGTRAEVAGTRQAITTPYVPVGERRFDVGNGAAFAAGDAVVVYHETNQDWIDAIGVDSCATRGGSYDRSDDDGLTCLQSPWTPSSVGYERTVTAVSGNTLTIDVPLVQALDATFGGGAIAKYTFAGRIRNCGVENLRGDSEYASATDTDHASYLVSLAAVDDAWVRDVTALHFVHGAVNPRAGARRVTVQDSTALDPVSGTGGGLAFHVDDGQLTLIQRCSSRQGRRDFVSGSAVPGPNVFLDTLAEQSFSDSGPLTRYATGTLYDNVTHHPQVRNVILGVEQRGNAGGGQGWAGAQQMFWNCVSDEHKVEQASPYFHNWSFGCRAPVQRAHPAGIGEYESFQAPLNPRSLYLKQLEDRLGAQAVQNIAR